MFPRLFTNTNVSNTFNGTIEQNGVGKINDIDGFEMPFKIIRKFIFYK